MSSDKRPIYTRTFKQKDVDAINELLATHWPWTEYDATFELDFPTLNGTGEVVVATADGSFAGFVWWLPKGTFNQSGYIKLIGIHRTQQSSGVGTVLMDAAESAIFNNADRSDVFLLVSAFNDQAREFYEGRGYVEVGQIEDYVEDGINEVLMRKLVK